jgi:uncharacterized membrane protein required for colicin V production
MIAAATQTVHQGFFDHVSAFLNNLPFGWFDVVLVALIAFGLFRGRKNGMTKEVLPTLQWMVTVLVCGLGCELAGQGLVNFLGWGKLGAYLAGYLVLWFVVFFIFVLVKNFFTPRLTGSNFFGRAEYYLGMVSGLVRYLCILLVALALLNAPFYTEGDIQQAKDYNARWFGGGLKGYSGDYFPTLQSVQAGVFKNSLTGPFIKKYLSVVLINSVPVVDDQPKPAPKKHPIIEISK